MAEVRGLCGEFIGNLHVQLHTRFMRDGRQMKHGIGGAAQRHIHGEGVQESLLRHDIPGTDIFLHQLHDLHARMLGKADSLGINRRNGSISLQAHSQRLRQTVHGVRRIHAGAGATGGAGLLFVLGQLFHRHGSRRHAANRLKHGGKAGLVAAHMACQHGAAGNEDRRNVHSGRRHQKPRHVLITVGDHHQAVKPMRHGHAFRAVADQISGHQGIFHADMSHGNAVTDGNGRKHEGRSARHCHSQLHSFNDLIQIHMSRNDLIVGAHNPDQRPLSLFLGDSERIEQASVGRLLYSCFH